MSHQANDILHDLQEDNRLDSAMECPRCKEIALVFSYHIRESVPGDPGDVYTIGEEWECEHCHGIATFFDHERRD